jgi:hypothetical protein
MTTSIRGVDTGERPFHLVYTVQNAPASIRHPVGNLPISPGDIRAYFQGMGISVFNMVSIPQAVLQVFLIFSTQYPQAYPELKDISHIYKPI